MLDRVENIFRIEKDDTNRILITSTVSNKNPEYDGDSYNTTVLTKEDALDLIGELYDLVEELDGNLIENKYPRNLIDEICQEIKADRGNLLKEII